jgi:hypothetical protein
LLRADGYGNHFRGFALFLQAHRFFHGDFVKRVHGHFDIGQVHAALVRFHADFDVVVDHPLDGYQDLHGVSLIPIGTVISQLPRALTVPSLSCAVQKVWPYGEACQRDRAREWALLLHCSNGG